ncbi:hypothetical protein DL546_007743 [Coniochaeta pulveracea]|uniref:Uncharacterized protein n=1 Tax=Coniochaeta pulveracea TaxID=177199 RepID=A0A420YIV7_9PEZI|nr:hypothetical protein DL546_007743 [Coniochaeta pulveracea]
MHSVRFAVRCNGEHDPGPPTDPAVLTPAKEVEISRPKPRLAHGGGARIHNYTLLKEDGTLFASPGPSIGSQVVPQVSCKVGAAAGYVDQGIKDTYDPLG